jgi:hypothetical protein
MQSRVMRIWFTGVILILSATMLGGCGRRDKWTVHRPPVYRAGGVVTWDGKPAPNAIVTFHADGGGISAVGQTDAAGRFRLGTFAADDGAVAGKHGVRVETIEVVSVDAEGRLTERSVMPAKYADAKTSGLVAEVTKQGPNKFTFDIIGPRRGDGSKLTP